MSEWIDKEEVLKQIDCWLMTGEYKYSNATHYLDKRISSIKPKESEWISAKDKLLIARDERDELIKLREDYDWLGEYKEKFRQNDWISVDDKLPDEDGEYLISMYHRFMIGGIYKKYTGRFVAKYYAEYKEWRIMNDVCTTVTHWQYLPELPKEDNADGDN